MKKYGLLSAFLLIAMLLSACASTATSTTAPVAPVTGPTTAAKGTTAATSAATGTTAATSAATGTTAATSAVTGTTAATTSASSASTNTPAAASAGAAPSTPTGAAAQSGSPAAAVATIPPDQLSQKGHLLICTDFPYPPQEFFDENGNPQGSDVEIGTEIANRLGLKPVFVNSVFDTIIAAVKSGKCDIVISAQNITADRQKQVSMIPYFQAGQGFVVQKGNPANIQNPTDLCGKPVAAESGTTEADYLQGTGDYKGKGLPVTCTQAGKKAPNLVVTQKDSDALQQLQSGKVVAYVTDSPVAAYYTVQHPDQFQVAGSIVEPVVEGISVPCGSAADCTNAPLSPTGAAVKSALTAMMNDGTYAKILNKWHLADSAVKP